MEPIIRVKNLSVTYQPKTPSEILALNNVSVDINDQEFLIVFGPSGCGKSTLLYSISGVEEDIDSGEIFFRGQDIRKMSKDEFILYHRNSAGLIFQSHNLILTLNVLSNVTLPLIFQGVGVVERKRRGLEILKTFGLEEIAKKLPSQLSGGQQQRVGIARALINNPDMILADEPTGNLDSQAAVNALDLLKDLNKRLKKTVILVTHESQYLPYADRVVFMKDGLIVDQQMKSGQNPLVSGKILEQKVYARVPKIIDYLGFNVSSEQYKRLEALIQNFLLKAITKENLYAELHKPMRRGGVSVFKQKAQRMVEQLIDIREHAAIIAGAFEEGPELDRRLDYVTEWIVSDYKHISNAQKAAIFGLLKNLLKGEFDQNKFEELLALPEYEKGAGLNLNIAKDVSNKLHLII